KPSNPPRDPPSPYQLCSSSPFPFSSFFFFSLPPLPLFFSLSPPSFFPLPSPSPFLLSSLPPLFSPPLPPFFSLSSSPSPSP
ncbi:hypothetical protein ACXWRS_11355, partial [Streptococcus pyogenes]